MGTDEEINEQKMFPETLVIHSRLYSLVCNIFRRLPFSQYLLERLRRIYPKIHHSVKRLTKGTVITIGRMRELSQEAEGARFVAGCSSVAFPKVYDLWKNGEVYYLVMEYMPGERLDRKWRSLTLDHKLIVMHMVHSFVEELLQPSPPGWIGAVSEQGGFDFCAEGEIIPTFDTEAAYVDWRISTFALFAERSRSSAASLQEVRRAMKATHHMFYSR